MKKCILIITSILLLSCNHAAKKEGDNEKVAKKELKPFFDSDKIEHYYLNFSEDDFFKLARKEKLSKKEKEFLGIFEFSFPDSIPNEDFEKILLSHNYKKSKLSSKQEKAIKNIFSEKDSLRNEACSCIAEYRDIFIFKKNTKTVGIAKICFKNLRFEIVGSKIDTEGFGLVDELDKLKKTVRPESYSILVTD
ncbi:hypothetical protein EV144_102412 [Flavobacterium sp. 270]|uniref:hypothetical protein n=1 Tax=Flavobacterium sp. 270 TaxID=2512114 RepID=UPI001065C510|nr:hypothetical protein [Flavobacterium sp. 270]TDW49981.1 hypothetical protein EV144_102412 [Flavobacterium sp. 270]